MIDKAAFIERDLDISLTPRFPDWTVIDAQALVVGNVVVDANNNMTVQFRLYDVYGGQQQFATQYTVPTPLNWRRLAHKVADDIYSQLTGDPGYFDSRIVFVAESGYTDAEGKPGIRKRLAIMDQDGANPEFLLSGMEPGDHAALLALVADHHLRAPMCPIRATRKRRCCAPISTTSRPAGRSCWARSKARSDFSARFSPDGRSVAMTREAQRQLRHLHRRAGAPRPSAG